jgi:hypothetical protein
LVDRCFALLPAIAGSSLSGGHFPLAWREICAAADCTKWVFLRLNSRLGGLWAALGCKLTAIKQGFI